MQRVAGGCVSCFMNRNNEHLYLFVVVFLMTHGYLKTI